MLGGTSPAEKALQCEIAGAVGCLFAEVTPGQGPQTLHASAGDPEVSIPTLSLGTEAGQRVAAESKTAGFHVTMYHAFPGSAPG